MSSDNGYQIQKHPKGGYAAVMYFASDAEIRQPVEADRSFSTLYEALLWANGEPSEYGVSWDDSLDVDYEESAFWIHGAGNDGIETKEEK